MTRRITSSPLQQAWSTRGILAISAAAVAALAVDTGAATQTWNAPQTGTDSLATPRTRTGTWWDGVTGTPVDANGAKNWTPAGVAPNNDGRWIQGSDANFLNLGGTNPYYYNLTLLGAVEANSITQSGTLTRTAITGTGTLQLGAGGMNHSGGTLTIDPDVIFAANQTWFMSAAATINGDISQVSSGLTLTKTGGQVLTLTGTNNYTGATTVAQGSLTLSGNGTISPSASLEIRAGATTTLDYSGVVGNALVNRLNDTGDISLRGTLILAGNANDNVDEAVGGIDVALGGAILTLNPNAAKNIRFTADSLTRGAGAGGTLVVRGNNFGANATASQTANSSNIVLTNAPTLTGSGGAAGDPTISILPWAIGDNNGTGGGTDFLTYDATNGLRRLTSSEYVTTLGAGDSTKNFKLTGAQTVATDTAVNSLVFTSTTNLNGAGKLSVTSGGILSAGTTNIGTTTPGELAFGAAEGIIHAVNATTIGSTVTGTGGLTKAGGSTLTLTGSNSYSGDTIVNSGTLQLGGTGASGTAAGDVGNSTEIILNGGNLTVNRSNAIDITQNITGASGAVTLTGTGAKTLSGTNAIPGILTATGGRLHITGSTTVAGIPNVPANLVLNGNNITTVQSGSNLTVTGSILIGSGANQAAALYQTGGTVQNGSGDPSFQVGSASSTGSYGFYSMSGGSTVVVGSSATPKIGVAYSTNARGLFYMSGGTIGSLRSTGAVNDGTMGIGQGNGSHGVWYMTGGSYNNTGAISLGSSGTGRGEMTISNATMSAPITVGEATDSIGILNLNAGGVLQNGAGNVIKTSTNAAASLTGPGLRHVNFDGGTLRHTAGNQQTQIVASTEYSVFVRDGGAIFDVVNAAGNQVIAEELIAPTGNGIEKTTYTIANGGSGYIGAPVVAINDVPGATAVANMVPDGNGTYSVGSITITSPGINAAVTNPTFSFSTVPGVTAAAVAATTEPSGALTTAANVSGGITKVGLGTLTLNAVNTYTGPTTISAGKLALAGSIDSSAGVSVAAGATFDTSAKAGYAVNGLSGSGSVVVGNGKTLTLADPAGAAVGTLAPGGSAGTLTISSGNLALADGTAYAFEVDGTTEAPLSDRVNLTGTGSTVSFAGDWTLSLTNLGSVDPTGLEFVLFDSVAAIAGVGNWTIDYGTTGWSGGSIGLNPGDNTQVILSGLTAPIPEPAGLGVLLLGAATGLLGRRRRQGRN